MSGTRDEYRISVDYIACNGHGMCASYLPDNVGLDEWGYPVITNETVAPSQLRQAKRAALLCPELALRIERIQEKAGSARK